MWQCWQKAINFSVCRVSSCMERSSNLLIVINILVFSLKKSWSDDQDLNRQMRSLYIRCNTLIRNFSYCTNEVKIQLFRAFCSNMYCAPLWCNYKQSSMRKLTVVYNNVFRRLMSLPRFCSASNMFVSSQSFSCGELLCNITYSFKNRVLTSKNILVQTVVRASGPKSTIFQMWQKHLYVH